MKRIVAISVDCVTAINRKVYEVLAQKGYEVHLLIPTSLKIGDKEIAADSPVHPSIQLHTLPLLGTNPRVHRFEGFEKLMNSLKPEVVYLNNDPVSFLGRKTANWTKKNNARLLCLTCENQAFDLLSTYKRRGWRSIPASLTKAFFLWQVRKKVDHLFTINHKGLELFSKIGFSSVSITPLGYDPDVFFPNATSRTRIRKKLKFDGLIIAYFGRLVPEKGILMLLDTLKQLQTYEWRFMIDRFERYDNPFAKEVEQQINASALHSRTLYIDADHIEIADYMNAADIIVLPSYSTPGWVEQYGRVAPEAMACGKVVITSDSGELPYLVGDGGLIFKEKNTGELKNILENAITNENHRVEISQRAILKAKNLSIYSQVDCIVKYL